MKRGLVAIIGSVLVPGVLSARFVMSETKMVPVPRLAENIERQLQQKPGNIELRLNLARLHAMAYALKATEFEAKGKDEALEAWFGNTPPFIPGPTKSAPTREHEQRAQADLQRAMAIYEDVLKRAPENFIAHLGYGWSLEQAGRKPEAIARYRKVVELALPMERTKQGWWYGQDPATLEAIKRLEELLDPTTNAPEIAALQEKKKTFDPMSRMITPIAIPLGSDLTAPLALDARVFFDADGSGIPRRWTWIDKNAGWLVYDADGRGEITSALQWFGSVTFWLFWSNGYEALSALDDNGDGELRGEELRHLAIWQDRNQNGISERGEVRPLADHRIIALSTRYKPGDGLTVAAHSAHGVVFPDGTTRPSFDVILRTTPRHSWTVPVH